MYVLKALWSNQTKMLLFLRSKYSFLSLSAFFWIDVLQGVFCQWFRAFLFELGRVRDDDLVMSSLNIFVSMLPQLGTLVFYWKSIEGQQSSFLSLITQHFIIVH